MSKTFSFEKLEVWQLSRNLVAQVYSILKDFPEDEKFGLALQMKRAAISVSSNIAEGASRMSPKEQAHFYQISFSSLLELLNQMVLSVDLNFLKEEKYLELRRESEKISNMINALRQRAISQIEDMKTNGTYKDREYE
ncbi:MAG: four helix bundle protein [Chitinophagaceae bacterium]|nr:four helix bundle protein [Chitinophagaceae bacterium]